MTKFLLLFAGTLAFFLQVDGRRSWGSCPEVQLVDNFDPQLYTGRWYEIRRDSEISFEKGSSCVTATYGEDTYRSVSVYNHGTNSEGGYDTIRGTATC